MKTLLRGLADSPSILEDLLREVPYGRLNYTLKDSWSIMQHLDHLLEVQDVFTRRIELFRDSESPVIAGFQPDNTPREVSESSEIPSLLRQFKKSREAQLNLIESLPRDVLARQASHSEHIVPLSFQRMLTHFLSHDHFHIYRIEELGAVHEDLITRW